MDMRSAFPGQYIKSGDLAGGSKVIVIKSVSMQDVGDDRKPVVQFEGSDQGFVLNQTNSNSIADLLGFDSDKWAGKRIELYQTKTQFGSKMVDAIRVRPVGESDPNDDIPEAFR